MSPSMDILPVIENSTIKIQLDLLGMSLNNLAKGNQRLSCKRQISKHDLERRRPKLLYTTASHKLENW